MYRVISERRDMRRFVPGGVVPEDVLVRLLQAAHAAPSVGLMQPWRFIRITDQRLRFVSTGASRQVYFGVLLFAMALALRNERRAAETAIET